MDIIYIPLEIQYYLLKFINDTELYLNCRLVCRDWYHELKNIKVFKNNELFHKIIFYSNKIEFLNMEEKIVKKVLFKSMGETIIEEKNNFGYTRTTKFLPPYKIVSKELTSNYQMLTKECNINYESVKKTYTPLVSCVIS